MGKGSQICAKTLGFGVALESLGALFVSECGSGEVTTEPIVDVDVTQSHSTTSSYATVTTDDHRFRFTVGAVQGWLVDRPLSTLNAFTDEAAARRWAAPISDLITELKDLQESSRRTDEEFYDALAQLDSLLASERA